jgi:hypothetical protein
MKRIPLRGLIVRENVFLFSPVAAHPSMSAALMGRSSLKDRKFHERGTKADNEKRV